MHIYWRKQGVPFLSLFSALPFPPDTSKANAFLLSWIPCPNTREFEVVIVFLDCRRDLQSLAFHWVRKKICFISPSANSGCVCDISFPFRIFPLLHKEIFLLFSLLVLSISNCKCKWLTFFKHFTERDLYIYRHTAEIMQGLFHTTTIKGKL